jgi:hypothetical protein
MSDANTESEAAARFECFHELPGSFAARRGGLDSLAAARGCTAKLTRSGAVRIRGPSAEALADTARAIDNIAARRALPELEWPVAAPPPPGAGGVRRAAAHEGGYPAVVAHAALAGRPVARARDKAGGVVPLAVAAETREALVLLGVSNTGEACHFHGWCVPQARAPLAVAASHIWGVCPCAE